MTDRSGFPTPIVAKLTGVSVTTLDNWDRRGFLKASVRPAGSHGVPRVYSFHDLIAIRIARDLKREGIPLQALRRVVTHVRTRKGPTANALTSTTLVADGRRDVYEIEGDVSMSKLHRPGQRVLLIVPLGELVAELQAKTRTLHAA